MIAATYCGYYVLMSANKTDQSKTGVVLAGFNPPGSSSHTNFTDELFHTELFQVNFKQNINFPVIVDNG